MSTTQTQPALNFKRGTQEQFDALTTFSPGSFYYTTDTYKLYMGDTTSSAKQLLDAEKALGQDFAICNSNLDDWPKVIETADNFQLKDNSIIFTQFMNGVSIDLETETFTIEINGVEYEVEAMSKDLLSGAFFDYITPKAIVPIMYCLENNNFILLSQDNQNQILAAYYNQIVSTYAEPGLVVEYGTDSELGKCAILFPCAEVITGTSGPIQIETFSHGYDIMKYLYIAALTNISMVTLSFPFFTEENSEYLTLFDTIFIAFSMYENGAIDESTEPTLIPCVLTSPAALKNEQAYSLLAMFDLEEGGVAFGSVIGNDVPQIPYVGIMGINGDWATECPYITHYYPGLTVIAHLFFAKAGEEHTYLNINNLGDIEVFKYWDTPFTTSDCDVSSALILTYVEEEDTSGNMVGRWKVLNYAKPTLYDKVQQNKKTDDKEYQLLFRDSVATPVTTSADGETAWGLGITANPSKKSLTATTFVGSLQGNADTATSAESATSASYADTAATAETASKAAEADYAAEAAHATTADSASTAAEANHAATADTASTAAEATHATTADSATTATTATSATTATNAETAAVATKLGTATKGGSTRPIYLSSGTPTNVTSVAVKYGGTGATTATNARTNLSVYSKAEVDGFITGVNTSIANKTYPIAANTNGGDDYILVTSAGGENSVTYNVFHKTVTVPDGEFYTRVKTDGAGHIVDADNPTTISGYGITDAYTKTEVDTAINNAKHSVTAGVQNTDDAIVTLSGTSGDNSVTYSASHSTSGVTAGTYRSVTVNDTGHVTAGTNPTTLSGYGITNAYTKTNVDNLLKPINTSLSTLDGKVTTLVGTDASKSVRSIASEEVAEIVAGADTSYDTLKKIADWILDHPNSVAEINQRISDNTTNITNITNGTTTVPKATDATNAANATNATNAETASKLSSNAGDTNSPIYFTNGVPTAITSVKVAKGGTGATTAAGARSNLSVYSKTEVDGLITGVNTNITNKKYSIAANGSGDSYITLTGTNGENSVTYNVSHKASTTTGTYRSVTVDAAGHVTSGTNPTTISGYGITDAYTKTEVDTAINNVTLYWGTFS